ncbi:hypothetical protein, partial [Streptomyces halstedii]|uniref:hypothetical protein n=1 Tax=Streptomyces halstedii TaxID=1944 RepID=UPI0033BDB905
MVDRVDEEAAERDQGGQQIEPGGPARAPEGLNATGNNDGNQISVTPDGSNYTEFRLIRLSG